MRIIKFTEIEKPRAPCCRSVRTLALSLARSFSLSTPALPLSLFFFLALFPSPCPDRPNSPADSLVFCAICFTIIIKAALITRRAHVRAKGGIFDPAEKRGNREIGRDVMCVKATIARGRGECAQATLNYTPRLPRLGTSTFCLFSLPPVARPLAFLFLRCVFLKRELRGRIIRFPRNRFLLFTQRERAVRLYGLHIKLLSPACIHLLSLFLPFSRERE